jgi:hypothetical protein
MKFGRHLNTFLEIIANQSSLKDEKDVPVEASGSATGYPSCRTRTVWGGTSVSNKTREQISGVKAPTSRPPKCERGAVPEEDARVRLRSDA